MLCSNNFNLWGTTLHREQHCTGNKHYNNVLIAKCDILMLRGRCDRDRMVVGYTTTYGISAYHHRCCEFESRTKRDLQHYVIKLLVTARWFSPTPPVSSTNKTDRHDKTEILLKVALSTINHQSNIHTLMLLEYKR